MGEQLRDDAETVLRGLKPVATRILPPPGALCNIPPMPEQRDNDNDRDRLIEMIDAVLEHLRQVKADTGQHDHLVAKGAGAQERETA